MNNENVEGGEHAWKQPHEQPITVKLGTTSPGDGHSSSCPYRPKKHFKSATSNIQDAKIQ